MKIKIRPIKKADLEILYSKMFNHELPWLHGKNLADQERGDSLWLVGWVNKDPVAHLQIKFKNPEIKEIKSQINACPHLGTLFVKPKYRNKGIAKKLMGYAESLIKKKGYKKVGLSVEKNNVFLNNLYNDLGYKDWKKGAVIDSWKKLKKGKLKKVSEKCNYLIKKLK